MSSIENHDLDPPEVVYGVKKERNYNDCLHHMAANSMLYDFANIGVIPLFIKTFVDIIPSYIDGEISHIVTEKEINRMDLISWKYYKTPELFWIILAVNDILNPFEISEGTVLRILPKDFIEYHLIRYLSTSND